MDSDSFEDDENSGDTVTVEQLINLVNVDDNVFFVDRHSRDSAIAQATEPIQCWPMQEQQLQNIANVQISLLENDGTLTDLHTIDEDTFDNVDLSLLPVDNPENLEVANTVVALTNVDLVGSCELGAEGSSVHLQQISSSLAEIGNFGDQQSCDNLPVEAATTASVSTVKVLGSKKRNRNNSKSEEWQRNVEKKKRMMGEAYLGYSRIDRKKTNKVKTNVLRGARKMGPSCSSVACKKFTTRDCASISFEKREELFNQFWKEMTWELKKTYVCATIRVEQTKHKRCQDRRSRRSSSLFYSLKFGEETVPVCREMYLSTLGITRSEVHYWIGSFNQNNVPHKGKSSTEMGDPPSDKEDGDLEDHNEIPKKSLSVDGEDPKINVPTKAGKQENLENFFESLPSLPSHYCRKSTAKKYLQTDIRSWTQLYNLYKSSCKEKEILPPLSRYTFDLTRKKKNLGLHTPKKDKCDICTGFEQKNITQELYLDHQQKKEAARREKEKDKQEALVTGSLHVLCCDLMAVQPVPKLSASSAYFKLKLTAHNFTIYNMVTQDAMAFWFDETQATLGASTFASCLCSYITELLDQSLNTVILYSDGCGYQNRNAILSNALLHLSVTRKVTIVQKFLEKGHTQMECDSVHSTIERRYEHDDVYLPNQYVLHSISARRVPMPYRAKLLDFSFFKDFSQAGSMAYSSIRPGRKPGDPTVNDLRQLQYEPSGKIYYKLSFNDELKEIPTRRQNVGKMSFNSFPQLLLTRPLIPRDKYTDLQSLKVFMPVDCHDFYDHIPHEEESRRQSKMSSAKEKARKEESIKTKKKTAKK